VTRGALGEVRGLRAQVEHVLYNLVANAVKYLGPQATPQVEIGRAERDGTVEYFVRDNGIGVDPAYHAKIFEPFQRLKDVDEAGSGVGLTIVKKIVEAAGGRVRVESAAGAGSTFFFTWPQAAERT
jgi:signal transduction histidine kinase